VNHHEREVIRWALVPAGRVCWLRAVFRKVVEIRVWAEELFPAFFVTGAFVVEAAVVVSTLSFPGSK